MTIKEIAKLANVSLGTVDRVLHKRGNVSKKTEEKILKILKEVDYRPNIYARGLVLNKSFKIVALLPSFECGEYWEVPSIGVNKAAGDFEQFGITIQIYYFDQNDIDSFVEQAKKVVEERPDGVIIAPVINFEAVKLAQKLHRLQIPYSLIDSNIPEGKAVSFIGQDSFQSGRLAAKLLKLCTAGNKLLIVSIKNNENHNKTLQRRIEGFNDYLLNLEDLDNLQVEEVIIDQRKEDWKRSLEELLLKKIPNGVYVPSSKVHYVAEVIHKNKNLRCCSLVGNDLIANNAYYISSGVIDFVIGQRPENQGYLAVEMFYKFLVTKQAVNKAIYLPLDIITRENLQYYHRDE